MELRLARGTLGKEIPHPLHLRVPATHTPCLVTREDKTNQLPHLSQTAQPWLQKLPLSQYPGKLLANQANKTCLAGLSSNTGSLA